MFPHGLWDAFRTLLETLEILERKTSAIAEQFLVARQFTKNVVATET